MSIISWILPLFASFSHLLHSSSQIFSFNTATLASSLRIFMFDLYLSLSSLGIAALYSALVYPRVSKSLTSFCTSFLTGYSSLHLVLTKKGGLAESKLCGKLCPTCLFQFLSLPKSSVIFIDFWPEIMSLHFLIDVTSFSISIKLPTLSPSFLQCLDLHLMNICIW